MVHEWAECPKGHASEAAHLVDCLHQKDPSWKPAREGDTPGQLEPELEDAFTRFAREHKLDEIVIPRSLREVRIEDAKGLQPPRFHNQYCLDDWDMYHGNGPRGMGPAGDGCVCALDPDQDSRLQQLGPKLWDKRPDSVTHIAGPVMFLFGRYMRQRCAWCGYVLLEYDLTRVAVPEGQDPMPGHWVVMSLVRVDGNMSAEVESVEEEPDQIKLPMDSCGFDPDAQVGS